MKLLLDTHALLWWLADDPTLSLPAKEAIANPDNLVAVSAATVWEITIKQGLGKLVIDPEWYDILLEESFERLPITWEHAKRVDALPDHHRDPFDRLLVAQALIEEMTLVTRDEQILRYGAASILA